MPRQRIGMQLRREQTKSVKPDAENYSYPDSGCLKASKYLRYQSLCFECPFEECKKLSRVGAL